jgi:hypothetical protein
MSIDNNWRNKQLGYNFNFLQQEICCLDFLKRHKNLTWGWYGGTGRFYDYCKSQFAIEKSNCTGLIIINDPVQVTPKKFVAQINSLINDNICAVYLAINRYEFVSQNDLNIDYKDNIKESITQIVEHIKVPMVPIDLNHNDVDGRHFVGVHGLDIYKYENN